MQTIVLNAAGWKTALDFYDALLFALHAPEGHARNANAVVESIVWGGIDEVEPPYTIRIENLDGASKDILTEIGYLKEDLPKQRKDFRVRNGRDIEVFLETESN